MDRWAGVPYVDEPRLRAAVPGPRDADPVGAVPEAARLAMVARHTTDAVVLYRPDGRIEWVNSAFERMTGWSAVEVVGADRLDLVRGPFLRTPEFARLRADLAAGRDTSAEFVTRTKDGSSYWVAIDVRAAVEDGRLVGLIGVERDITTRRYAEERARQTLGRAESLGVALRHEKRLLSAVLASIPHLVWWKNRDLRHVGANQAYLTFRGLRSPAEVVGRRDDQLDLPAGSHDLGPDVAQLERVVLSSQQAVAGRTVSVPREGRPPRTFLVSVLPHLDGDEFSGIIGIAADVSQVADLERQLAQTSRLESIGQLAAGIAHEINTPVQYICDNTRFVAETFRELLAGLAQVAEAVRAHPGAGAGAEDGAFCAEVARALGALDLEFVAAEVPSALDQSLEGLDRVSGIVRAMKDFSHPGTGYADVDVNRVVDSTLQVSRSEWKYVAELQLDLAPDAGAVPCLEGEVKQVLLNVIVNAAQAIAERRDERGAGVRGHLAVTTRRTPTEVLIAVTDDGIGMDDATRQRVFDPFFTTKPVGKGTGQGLNIAHSIIVVKHGGRIEVDSALGRGTTFTVALPVTMPHRPDDGDAADGDTSDDGSAGGAAS